MNSLEHFSLLLLCLIDYNPLVLSLSWGTFILGFVVLKVMWNMLAT